MARLLFFLFIILIALSGLILFRYATETHRLLPETIHQPPKTEAFEEWKPFSSVVGKFQVMLPILPQHASERLPVPDTEYELQYEMYVSEDHDGSTFMISIITYPEGLNTSRPDVMLENVMNEMVLANPDNRLQKMSFNPVDGHPALDFFIESPAVIVNSRGILVGKTMYLITMIDTAENYNPEEFAFFIDSFSVKP